MSHLLARRIVLVVGLALGLALGLVYTWVLDPVELVNTYPALLRTDYRRDWVRLAAVSYSADNDLERALTRLKGLEQQDIAKAIEPLIEEYAAAGRSAEILRSLTTLAQALDVQTPAMLVYLDVPTRSPTASAIQPSPTLALLRTPSATRSPSPTPRPTLTSTPTPRILPPSPTFTPSPTEQHLTPLPPTPTPPLLARLHLAEQKQICQPGQTEHIEVVVRDEHGTGLAGVKVWLIWPSGADRAITGLKPEQGKGYADFDAKWGVNYSLGIGELGTPLITAIRLEPCPVDDDKDVIIGSWRIVLEPYSLEADSPEAE